MAILEQDMGNSGDNDDKSAKNENHTHALGTNYEENKQEYIDEESTGIFDEIVLHGESIPGPDDINMSYREAWRIGRQGCLGMRRNFWDPRIFTITWYFVCDGTDPVNFLVLYPYKKRGSTHLRPMVISVWELLHGYWIGNKCKIFYIPARSIQSRANTLILEGLSAEFYQAVLKCVYECKKVIEFAHKRVIQLTERRHTGSYPCKISAPRQLKQVPVAYIPQRLTKEDIKCSSPSKNS